MRFRSRVSGVFRGGSRFRRLDVRFFLAAWNVRAFTGNPWVALRSELFRYFLLMETLELAKGNLTFLGGKGVLISFGVKEAIWHCFLDVRFPFRVSKDVLEKCRVSTVRFPLANSRVSLLSRDEQNVANRVRAFRRLPLELL